MGKKLTQEEFEKRIYDLFGNLYSVVSEYKGKRQLITIHCNKHNINFTVTAECFMRGTGDIRATCPKCNEEKIHAQQVELICAYCGKHFYRPVSKLNNSKSGLYFCCREHKDLAQRIESGLQFDVIRPNHFGKINSNYRNLAYRTYEHKCAVCGWDEDERILQVHHIDGNHCNNEATNLIILCPTCHSKLTLRLYKLVDNQIIPNN